MRCRLRESIAKTGKKATILIASCQRTNYEKLKKKNGQSDTQRTTEGTDSRTPHGQLKERTVRHPTDNWKKERFEDE